MKPALQTRPVKIGDYTPEELANAATSLAKQCASTGNYEVFEERVLWMIRLAHITGVIRGADESTGGFIALIDKHLPSLAEATDQAASASFLKGAKDA